MTAYNITDELRQELDDLAKALTEKYYYEDACFNGEYPFVADSSLGFSNLRLHCIQTLNLVPSKSLIQEFNEVIENHKFILCDWWYEWNYSPRLKGGQSYRKARVNPYQQFLSVHLLVKKHGKEKHSG